MRKNTKYLYQIGEGNNSIRFDRMLELSLLIKKAVKTKQANAHFSDGEVDLGGETRNFLESREIKVAFPLYQNTTSYSIDHINKVLYSNGLLKVFFLEKIGGDDNTTYKVLWNYCRIKNGINDMYEPDQDSGQEGQEMLEATLTLESPFYFEANDTSLVGSDIGLFSEENNLYFDKPGFIFDDGKLFDSTESFMSIVLSTVRIVRKDFFEDSINCGESESKNKSINYTDYFYRPEAIGINTDKSQTFTIANNSEDSYDIDLETDTSMEGFYNLINIKNSTPSSPALLQDETIRIYNGVTNTGFIFTWKRSYTVESILINTGKGTVYDLDKMIELNPLEDFELRFDTTNRRNYILSFASTLKNPYSKQTTENIVNVINGSNNSLDITIKNLKTFVTLLLCC